MAIAKSDHMPGQWPDNGQMQRVQKESVSSLLPRVVDINEEETHSCQFRRHRPPRQRKHAISTLTETIGASNYSFMIGETRWAVRTLSAPHFTTTHYQQNPEESTTPQTSSSASNPTNPRPSVIYFEQIGEHRLPVITPPLAPLPSSLVSALMRQRASPASGGGSTPFLPICLFPNRMNLDCTMSFF